MCLRKVREKQTRLNYKEENLAKGFTFLVSSCCRRMPGWQGTTRANLLRAPTTPAVPEGQRASFCPAHQAPAAAGCRDTFSSPVWENAGFLPRQEGPARREGVQGCHRLWPREPVNKNEAVKQRGFPGFIVYLRKKKNPPQPHRVSF